VIILYKVVDLETVIDKHIKLLLLFIFYLFIAMYQTKIFHRVPLVRSESKIDEGCETACSLEKRIFTILQINHGIKCQQNETAV